jgi:GntR family transcriptional regulator, transcriptional repressor for pyruvate dehydrogenase complex
MPDGATQLFRTVRVSRASQDIVQQIKDNIFAGKLTPGDRLPSEKELAEQFGLSRITVRDALRILESQGLITIKVGAGGGAFVADPNMQSANDLMTDLLRLQGASTRELIEARLVIETSIVTYASERATAADLKLMQQTIDAARAGRAAGDSHFTPHSVDFHIALASAAKNQVLLFTVNSFRTLFYETLEKLLPDDQMAARAISDHQKILDAVTAHDAEQAIKLMRVHLEYFEKRARKLEQSR